MQQASSLRKTIRCLHNMSKTNTRRGVKKNQSQAKRQRKETQVLPKDEEMASKFECEDFHNFSTEEVSGIQQSLLSWYDKNKRDLPWRNITTADVNERAYATWVSEIMLQQTQVATVINYYNKWMKKWPTLEDLASSNIEEVNEAWSGLGYYSRGRRLMEGAQKVVKEMKGQMPRCAADLEKNLPGVGKYTAGAIASIALGEATGVVDGNVIRVLSRMRMIGGNTTLPAVMDRIWSIANNVVDPDRPGDFNQAMMELGATVCTPKAPTCEACPVSSYCRAYSRTKQDKMKASARLCASNNNDEKPSLLDIEECLTPDCKLCLPGDQPWDKELGVMNLPRKPKKSKAREECHDVVLVYEKTSNGKKQKYLVCQRPNSGLLAGLWEFIVQPEAGSKQEMVEKLCQDLDVSKSDVLNVQNIGEVSHQFSHIHHQYKVWSAAVSNIDNISLDSLDKCTKWLTEEEIKDAAISTGMRKVFKLYKDSQDPTKGGAKRKRASDDDVILQEPKKSQKSIADFFSQKR